MSYLRRRDFLSLTGLAAGGGLIGATLGRPLAIAQQAGRRRARRHPESRRGERRRGRADHRPAARRAADVRAAADSGEYHLVGGHVMTRMARPADTGGVYELATFTGRTGATMPRHVHRSSHAALLVTRGDVELELDGRTLAHDARRLRQHPARHAARLDDAVGSVAACALHDGRSRGQRHSSRWDRRSRTATCPRRRAARSLPGGSWRMPRSPATSSCARGAAPPARARVTNLVLPSRPGAYVLLDGGGERFGGNTFLARNANTNGQFLFIITEGGPGGGVGAHFHARHFENFFALDGETLGWAYGKAVSLKAGDYFQAPPRNLHGFRLTQDYNRFAAFLTPGIFERFFTRGGAGQNGVGRQAHAAAGRGAGRRGAVRGRWRARTRRRGRRRPGGPTCSGPVDERPRA